MKKTSLLLLFTALLTGCTTTVNQADENPVLSIEGGQIQGVKSDVDGVLVYKGVPYAAPPVGDLRWKRPQPVVAWQGVKVADTFSDAAMQRIRNPQDGQYGTEFHFRSDDPNFSEDCLYLNVWAPQYAPGHPEKKLPVAMWVHGGAYFGGWGFEMEMDGDAWAQRDVILVTINYRLGIFGFLNHSELSAEDPDHVSGNYGLLDQIAALQWIKNNIAQFGGDPDNITVFGQSAGGASIRNLCVSPMSKGLIAKAIVYFLISKINTIYEQLPPQHVTDECVELRHFTIIDEAHYMLGFDNQPLRNLIAVGRNKGMSIILATQSMDSYRSKYFDFYTNAQYPLIMKQQTINDSVLRDLYGLNQREMQELRQDIAALGKGELLIKNQDAYLLGMGKKWKKITVTHLI